MKILITGASGFIGSNVVQEALTRGYEVIAFDRKSKPQPEGVIQFLGDITDRNAINEAVSQADGAINLAGILGTAETVDNPYPAIESNLIGGLNFLEACRQHKKRGVQITVGNYWMNSTYPISKRALEKLALMYNKEHGTQIAVVRGLSVYGEGQKLKPVRKIVPTFVDRALNNEDIEIYGSGESIQDQIYVKDIAKILVEALINPNTRYDKVYSAGTGVRSSVKDIAELIVELTGSKSNIIHIPMRKGETDNAEILGEPETLEELGITEFTNIREGYKRTIDYYAKTKQE